MGKIIKYEWRKQRTARLIILFGLAVCLLAFLAGIILKKDTTVALSIGIMFAGAFLVIFYTGIESLLVFNRDLRTKQSHMLWMIPKSVWEILGGKFIAAILQMFFVFAAFTVAGCICFTVGMMKVGGIKMLFDAAKQLADAILLGGVDWKWFLIVMLFMFVAWAEIIMIGFLAIIISRTLFLNSKFAGLFSVILFFVINWIVEKGYSLICDLFHVSALEIQIWDFVYYAVVGIVLFVVSGVLADQKLSV